VSTWSASFITTALLAWVLSWGYLTVLWLLGGG